MIYPTYVKTIARFYRISCKTLLEGPWDRQSKKARRILVWYYREIVGMGYREISILTGVPMPTAHRTVANINEKRQVKDKLILKITSDLYE